ncbi:MAG: hypothetical protein ACLP07_17900 [Terracidiphilus sp.]
MTETADTYSSALFSAYDELDKLGEQERTIAIRKAQLRQTVKALYPLVFPEAVDIKSLSLPDAMRLVLRSAGRALATNDFKTKLEDIGFDLDQYSDPKANILTAMKRMVDAGEMHWVPDSPKKTVTATSELKPVPEVPSSLPVPGGIASFLDALGQGVATGLAAADEGGSKEEKS